MNFYFEFNNKLKFLEQKFVFFLLLGTIKLSKGGKMVIANYIAYVLTLIGALNWGLVGIFNFNLVAWICMGYRNGWAIAIYVLVALAAIWLIISPIISKGVLDLGKKDNKDNK